MCGGPLPDVDAGIPDAGPPPDPDPVSIAAASDTLGARNTGAGCGCTSGPGQVLLGALALVLFRRRKAR